MEESGNAQGGRDAPVGSGAEGIIDMPSVLSRVMGDTEFLKEMLTEFSASTGSFIETIRNAIQGRDAVLLSKTAHQLKGAASNLSLVQIAGRAAELTLMGRSADLDHAGAALDGLERAIGDFETFLQNSKW